MAACSEDQPVLHIVLLPFHVAYTRYWLLTFLWCRSFTVISVLCSFLHMCSLRHIHAFPCFLFLESLVLTAGGRDMGPSHLSEDQGPRAFLWTGSQLLWPMGQGSPESADACWAWRNKIHCTHFIKKGAKNKNKRPKMVSNLADCFIYISTCLGSFKIMFKVACPLVNCLFCMNYKFKNYFQRVLLTNLSFCIVKGINLLTRCCSLNLWEM